jgi:hypothetical protein
MSPHFKAQNNAKSDSKNGKMNMLQTERSLPCGMAATFATHFAAPSFKRRQCISSAIAINYETCISLSLNLMHAIFLLPLGVHFFYLDLGHRQSLI